MLHTHEIGKIVKAVEEITKTEDAGEQVCSLFLWQVKWTRQGHIEVPDALCSCLSLSYLIYPRKGLEPESRFPKLLCSSSVIQSPWIHFTWCLLTCPRICTSSILTYSLLPIVRDNANFLGSFLFKWHLFVLSSAFMHHFAFSKRKRYLNEEKGIIAAKRRVVMYHNVSILWRDTVVRSSWKN